MKTDYIVQVFNVMIQRKLTKVKNFVKHILILQQFTQKKKHENQACLIN